MISSIQVIKTWNPFVFFRTAINPRCVEFPPIRASGDGLRGVRRDATSRAHILIYLFDYDDDDDDDDDDDCCK